MVPLLAGLLGGTLHGSRVPLSPLLGSADAGNAATGLLHTRSAQFRAKFEIGLAGSPAYSTGLLSSPLHGLGVLLGTVLGAADTGNVTTAQPNAIRHEG